MKYDLLSCFSCWPDSLTMERRSTLDVLPICPSSSSLNTGDLLFTTLLISSSTTWYSDLQYVECFRNMNAPIESMSMVNKVRKKSFTGKSSSEYCGCNDSPVFPVELSVALTVTHVYSPAPCMNATIAGMRPLRPSPM